MHILLVNDDGIYAQGIRTLASVLARKHRVTVVAPHAEMSGTGHAVTFNRHIQCTKLQIVQGADCYAITGTPADCAKFGYEYILQGQQVDCLISGINNGYNLGTDVVYSGTVNAALEGAELRLPSIAISQNYGLPHYIYAAQFLDRNLEQLLQRIPQDNATILSINVPHCDADLIRGVRFCRTGVRRYDDCYHADGARGYYITGKPLYDATNAEDSDVICAEQGYVTISPIRSDINDYTVLERLQNGEGLCK